MNKKIIFNIFYIFNLLCNTSSLGESIRDICDKCKITIIIHPYTFTARMGKSISTCRLANERAIFFILHSKYCTLW